MLSMKTFIKSSERLKVVPIKPPVQLDKNISRNVKGVVPWHFVIPCKVQKHMSEKELLMWHWGHGVSFSQIHRIPKEYQLGLKGTESVQNEKASGHQHSMGKEADWKNYSVTQKFQTQAISYGKGKTSLRIEPRRTIDENHSYRTDPGSNQEKYLGLEWKL